MPGSTPTREAIREAVTAELEDRSRAPRAINSGRCEDFAQSVLRRLGGETERVYMTGCEVDGAWTMGRWGGHVWIVADHLDLHFDAEAPAGTTDWQSLSFYRRKMEDPAHPIGPVGDAILSDPEQVTDGDVLRYIEDWWDVNVVYEYGPDGTKQHDDDIADATHTPTAWVKGELPTRTLKDCLDGRCPEREEWREWLRKENEARMRREGFGRYHDWFDGGIREPIIVDGQGPFIWDGWHRTAWAIDQGKGTVPAYLGVAAGPTPAFKRVDDMAACSN
ncbi:hypothetical protein [Salinibacter ruber]|jgi:hypothetical protein|uniref:Uncharacterized protein n=1 Tax=Salinibacter ruber TaxID=146919 RepID=A0A9X2TIX0_9BACT|nr:hypothetical protein [Salinibacter ruber]MCS3660129.1 hypothetical protein [Salinibacter ruber]MCS3709814.1 hypothetical protein [Salinibacter ruber]MCS4170358.1 hypothetical protein [Salinibacter ruber]